MSDLRVLLRQLEACVQEEIGAQARALEQLAVQAAALRSGQAEAMSASTAQVEAELAGAPARAARRADLLRKFGGHWGVDSRSLTLGSIALRSESEGLRLGRLRTELRLAAARTARQMRRNALAARLHQRAWGEILQGAMNAISEHDELPGGCLVDAQA